MPLPAHAVPTTTHAIVGHEGLRLYVPEFGAADGPPLLFIHGYSQSHLSWARQLTGQLSQRFRLIVPDLRGHGQSDKPVSAAAYDNSTPWARDIAAIIAQLGLNAPVLVGWSMGGKLIGDYLRLFGDSDLGGIVMVATSATSGRHQPAAAARQRSADASVAALDMYSDDFDLNLRATAAFLRACTAAPLPPDEAAWMLGFNMMCPPRVRAACRLRDDDYKPELAQVTKPALIIAGTRDQIMPPALTEELCAALPHARTSFYETCGHAPFWEDPERFNTDLAAFAGMCQSEVRS